MSLPCCTALQHLLVGSLCLLLVQNAHKTLPATLHPGATWFRLPGLRHPLQIAKTCYALLPIDANTLWAAMADG